MHKNVLIIGDFCYPNYMGGSSKHVFDLIENLPKYGIPTKLLTRGKSSKNHYTADINNDLAVYNKLKLEGNIKEINNLRIFNPSSYYNLISNADFIILQHPIMGLIGGIIAKLLRKPIVYHYHGPIHLEYEMKVKRKDLKKKLLWLFQKITVLVSDKVITHSEYMKNISIKEHSVPERKCIHLPPYITRIDSDVKLQFFTTPSKINILIPRRLTSRTGVVEFLESFLKIDKKVRDNYHIYISGKGELQQEVEILVAKDKSNLTYAGFLSYEELWSLYKKIDAVVVPTLDLEGFGYIILEAMSCGATPIVSQACGGGYDFVVKHYGKEYTFDVFSSKSIRDALELLSENKVNRKRNEAIANDYSLESMIKYYINHILHK